MKTNLIVAATLLLFSFNSFSQANLVASRVQVSNPHIFPHNGVFVFNAVVTEGELPNCSGNNRWAMQTDAPGAEALISIVISAKVANQTVTVVGDGSCDASNFGYRVGYVLLH